MSDLGLKDTAALQGELKHSTGHSQYSQHLPCYSFKLKPPVCEVDHIPPQPEESLEHGAERLFRPGPHLPPLSLQPPHPLLPPLGPHCSSSLLPQFVKSIIS